MISARHREAYEPECRKHTHKPGALGSGGGSFSFSGSHERWGVLLIIPLPLRDDCEPFFFPARARSFSPVEQIKKIEKPRRLKRFAGHRPVAGGELDAGTLGRRENIWQEQEAKP